MRDSFKPVSFILNRPLKRPEVAQRSDPQPEPMSLPPAKYIPQPKWEHPIMKYYDTAILRIDGVPHIEIDGDFVEVVYERHSGPQSAYPRPKPVPGLHKKPRGRPVPTKDSGERQGMTTYTCRACQKVFTRSDHMKRHVRSLHMNMEKSGCSPARSADLLYTQRHLQQHTRVACHSAARHLPDATTSFSTSASTGSTARYTTARRTSRASFSRTIFPTWPSQLCLHADANARRGLIASQTKNMSSHRMLRNMQVRTSRA